MTDEETKMLASHMGHSLNIHMDHYRCHLSIIERTKVARILCAVANGTLNRFEVPTKFEDVVVEDGDLVNQGKLVLHCTQIKHYWSRQHKQSIHMIVTI